MKVKPNFRTLTILVNYSLVNGIKGLTTLFFFKNIKRDKLCFSVDYKCTIYINMTFIFIY